MNRRTMQSLFAFLGLMTLGGCSAARPERSKSTVPADAIERVTEKGPVKLTVRLWPKAPRLSDLVEMEIEVESQDNVDFKPPAFGQAVGEFLVRDYSEKVISSATKAMDGGPRIRRFHYQLEPVHSGKHLIRSIAIDFEDKRTESENTGKSSFIESEPIEVEVTSEMGDSVPSLTDLEPMLPPRPLPVRLASMWPWLAIPLSALIVWLVWRRRKHAVTMATLVMKSPAEIARESLAQLLRENLPAQSRFQEFYLRLTAIVRHYIEGVTGLHAPEQTTEEFLREMRSRNPFPAEQSVRLQEFLEAADMVKYAGQRPSTDQIELSIARAREFIEMRSTNPMSATLEVASAREC